MQLQLQRDAGDARMSPPITRGRAVPTPVLLLSYAYFILHSITKIQRLHTGDFEHFYNAAVAMRGHRDIYTSWHHGYLYPPLWAFLIQPLAALDLQRAAFVQLSLNAAALIGATLLSAHEMNRRSGGAKSWAALALIGAVATIALSGTLRSELEMGQTNSWVLLCMVGALYSIDRVPSIAGLLLGLAFNVKFQAIVLLPLLILRRRWRASAAFVVGAAAFGALPAISTGWEVNRRDLEVSCAGVLDLLGVHTGVAAAKNPINASFSLSLTSSIARLAGPGNEPTVLLAAACVFGACVFAGASVYRRYGLPALTWPDAPSQNRLPWNHLMALEWSAVAVAVLVFSPQTNSRHLVLMILPLTLAAALAVNAPRSRRIAIAAILVFFLGQALPPGSDRFHGAVTWWRNIGGRAAAILVSFALTAWASLRAIDSCKAPSPAPGGRPVRARSLAGAEVAHAEAEN